jgi:hypothetical protein
MNRAVVVLEAGVGVALVGACVLFSFVMLLQSLSTVFPSLQMSGHDGALSSLRAGIIVCVVVQLLMSLVGFSHFM